MWMLTNANGKVIEVDEKKITTVGRRNADLLLENDNSISKLHAKILVLKSDDSTNDDGLTCMIMDAGSKYGSYVIGKNNELTRITSEGYQVKQMDKVRFGLQQHVFTISYKSSHEYIVLVSRIYGNEREKLSEILQSVRGVLCDEWTPKCTHVTCPTVKLTEKVLCALVTGLYIVTKDYWYAMSEAVQIDNGILPNPEDFTPRIDSSILVTDKISLLPNSQRKTLFKDKIFIYFDEDQRKIYLKMIELAGGSSIMYDETWKPQDCCNDNIIVVQSIDSNQNNQSFQCRAIYLRLSQQKLRRIPEFEIPLAILCCSTEQYCNPHFKYDNLLKANKDNKNNVTLETTSKLLVMETQELSTFKRQNICNKKQINQIIPESISINTQINSHIQSQQMSCDTNKPSSFIKSESIMDEENTNNSESQFTNMQMSLQMQSQVSHETNKKASGPESETIIDRKNVIIPESEPFDTPMSSQIRSKMSHKERTKGVTTSQSKNNNISKSNLKGTQISSQLLNTNKQNCTVISRLPLNNEKQKHDKPRVMEVETVIPPIFSTRLAQNEQKSNDNRDAPEFDDSNDKFGDDDELEIKSPKQIQRRINKSPIKITTKKRTIDEILQASPNNKNKSSSGKKRKLNNAANSNMYSSSDEEMNESTPGNRIISGNEINVDNSPSIPSGANDIDQSISHYFSRNNLNKPKCIIPPKRLTLSDMVEWKPHKHN